MEIVGDIKTYDWGKVGFKSEVAQLASLNSSDFAIKPDTPYSELWMGDHPSGPATIKATGEELGKSLSNSPGQIGGHKKLPFLFKVLSIRKALSIQVHPNKSEAEQLHSERPDVYKDPNHKPELAIALTPFLALCGFRPYAEIYRFCQVLPPLRELLGGKENVKQLLQGDSGLKKCFHLLMSSPDDKTSACIQEIFSSYANVLGEYNLLETFSTINNDFPQDVGVLSLFFLNLIRLQPGEAIFLAANEIHAYLDGDCIECMACSDNVIRAGLTPKYKDVETLIASLNYEGLPPENKLFRPTVVDEFLQHFVPPVKDFAVSKIQLPSTVNNYLVKVDKFGSILLVLSGARILSLSSNEKLLVKRGSIIFIPGNVGDSVAFLTESCAEQAGEFVAYMAMYNNF